MTSTSMDMNNCCLLAENNVVFMNILVCMGLLEFLVSLGDENHKDSGQLAAQVLFDCFMSLWRATKKQETPRPPA
jgi:hypothetical protein